MKRFACLALTLTFSAAALAQYNFNLVMRTGDAGGYNLGGASSISSSSPSINDSGQVAIKALSATGAWGIWTGSAVDGTGLFTDGSAPDSISDASIDNSGRVVFGRNDSSGVYSFQAGTTAVNLLTNGPSGAASWSSFRALNNGKVGMKTNAGGNSYSIFDPSTNSFNTPVSQNGNYSFVFSSVQFNQAEQMAAPVQPLGGGTQIRRWNSNGSSTIIAQDTSLNAGSGFTRFFNNIGLSNTGAVAFNAALSGGGRGIYLSDGVTTTEIANTNNMAQDWGAGESFNMGVIGSLVYFRGKDRAGHNSLYVGNGTSLTKVVSQGDTLMTDLGPAIVRWPSDAASSFSGSPSINSLGHLVFTVSLVNPTNQNEQYGLGVFTATPVPEPATLISLGLGGLALLRRKRRTR